MSINMSPVVEVDLEIVPQKRQELGNVPHRIPGDVLGDRKQEESAQGVRWTYGWMDVLTDGQIIKIGLETHLATIL